MGFSCCELVLGLNASIAANVIHANTVFAQYARDEKPTMAFRRILLTTHHHDSATAPYLDELVHACPEEVGLRDLGVQDMPILVVEVVALRAPPELSAEEHVSDVTTGERALERLAVELRRESRPWARPHIHDRLDGVLFEQSDNVIGLVVRMADRVDAESVFAHSPIVADQADGCQRGTRRRTIARRSQDVNSANCRSGLEIRRLHSAQNCQSHGSRPGTDFMVELEDRLRAGDRNDLCGSVSPVRHS